MMQAKDHVTSPPLRTLERSAFLKCYNACPPPRSGTPPWTDPLDAVAASLPRDFHKEKWEKALTETAGAAPLQQAGKACTWLWSQNALSRMLQRVILEDYSQLLERIMPFIKCLNAYILDTQVRNLNRTFPTVAYPTHPLLVCRPQGLLKRQTTVYRASRMSKAQERQIQVGEKYRLGIRMYVATSTRKSSTDGLLEWQAGEMGTAVQYRWRFSIPKGCRQAVKISDVSGYGDEHEVLLVPYSAILVRGKNLDRKTGMIQVDAEVLQDSGDLQTSPLDLLTVAA